jgi:hypothetical protein
MTALRLAILLPALCLTAAERFVSPDGYPNGDGSWRRPWDLATALRSFVEPGDTIWIRGGVYRGRFVSRLQGTGERPIVIRNFQSERAVIDGAYQTAATSHLPAGEPYTTAMLSVADASLVEPSMVLSAGAEDLQVTGKSGNSLTVVRGWNGSCQGTCPPVPAGTVIALQGPCLTIEGAHVWLWGLEVTNSGLVDRVAKPGVARLGMDQGNSGVADRCNGCKYINLAVHNAGANGMFSSQAARNTEFHGNLLYYNGWQGPGEGDGKGHGIYAQNSSTSKRITDNLSFWNFGYGLQIYGSENALLDNFTVSGNFIFNNGEPTLLGVIRNLWIGGSNPPRNLGLTQNVTYFHSTISNQGQNFLGEGSGCQNTTVTGNRFLQLNSPLELGSGCVPALTGNVLWGNQMISAGAFPGNTYIAPGSRPSGQEVVVRPNAYEAGRAHIAVLNWSRASSVAVDLSGVLSAGNTYEIRDAQNYFGPAVVSGTYDGSLVNIPMNLTAIASPVGLVSKLPVHTSNEIGFFVLKRTGGAATALSITNVEVSNVTANSATITWTTNQAADSRVEYGTTTSYGASTPTTSTRQTSHSVTLTNLTAGTAYQFRVHSVNSSGSSAASGNASFSTLQDNVVADPPSLLFPADQAVKVSNTPVLVWTVAPWATSYDVYFGTTNPPTHVTNVTSTSFAPGTLANGGTFYWRVVAKAGSITATSQTRSFTVFNNGTAAVSVTPVTGTAGRQVFSFRARHITAATNIRYAQFLFTKVGLSPVNACYVSYDPTANVFYLLNDDSTQWFGLVGGSANTVGNSQCTVHGATSGSSRSGTDLVTTIDISVRSGFAGAKNIHQFSADLQGNTSGWQGMGTWNDTGNPSVVELISLTPNSGSGTSQVFTAVVRDGDGGSTIPFAQMLMNTSLSGSNGCFVHYDRASNTFFLLNNAGTSWSGVVGGSGGQVSNSQCTLKGTGSGGTVVGSDLTIRFNLDLTSSYAGSKKIFLQAVDNTGVIQPWRQMGVWTP